MTRVLNIASAIGGGLVIAGLLASFSGTILFGCVIFMGADYMLEARNAR